MVRGDGAATWAAARRNDLLGQEKVSSQSGVSQFGDQRPPQLPQGAPRPAIAAPSPSRRGWPTL
eukprot:789496-Prymnesium_polylepis.1